MRPATTEKIEPAQRLGLRPFRLRQRLKRPALILKHCLVKLTIREALACRTLYRKGRTFPIVVAKLDPVIASEIALGQISPLQRPSP